MPYDKSKCLWVEYARIIFIFLFVSSLSFMSSGCRYQRNSSLGIATATPSEFQREFPVLEVTHEYLATLVADQFEIVNVSNIPSVDNQDQTLRALPYCDEQSCSLFVEELETDQFYELRGPFLGWRPFTDLTWLNSDILAFDQWSNPHYGIHYEINFMERTIVSVSAIKPAEE